MVWRKEELMQVMMERLIERPMERLREREVDALAVSYSALDALGRCKVALRTTDLEVGMLRDLRGAASCSQSAHTTATCILASILSKTRLKRFLAWLTNISTGD